MDELIRVCTNPGHVDGYAMSWASDCGQGSGGTGSGDSDPGDSGPEDSGIWPRIRMLPSVGASRGRLPRPNEVWIWLATPARDGTDAIDSDWLRFLPLMSEPERERMFKLRFARDRWSYGAAHAGLRAILSPMLETAAHRIELNLSTSGKPMLSEAMFGRNLVDALSFSISHTRGFVAVAVSGRPVGIDVEIVRPLDDMRKLLVELMPSEAVAAFDAAPSFAKGRDLFYRFWTLGEAFIKATGLGLGQGLDSFAFTATGKPRLTRVTPGWGESRRWRFGHCSSTSADTSPRKFDPEVYGPAQRHQVGQ